MTFKGENRQAQLSSLQTGTLWQWQNVCVWSTQQQQKQEGSLSSALCFLSPPPSLPPRAGWLAGKETTCFYTNQMVHLPQKAKAFWSAPLEPKKRHRTGQDPGNHRQDATETNIPGEAQAPITGTPDKAAWQSTKELQSSISHEGQLQGHDRYQEAKGLAGIQNKIFLSLEDVGVFYLLWASYIQTGEGRTQQKDTPAQ